MKRSEFQVGKKYIINNRFKAVAVAETPFPEVDKVGIEFKVERPHPFLELNGTVGFFTATQIELDPNQSDESAD